MVFRDHGPLSAPSRSLRARRILLAIAAACILAWVVKALLIRTPNAPPVLVVDEAAGGSSAQLAPVPGDGVYRVPLTGPPRDQWSVIPTSAPFDRAAAGAALGAVNLAVCRKSGGPTGSGRVLVTFAPAGTVSAVAVDQPPFAGTEVGRCVAGRFSEAQVPAFGGTAVTVRKPFLVE
jgi:hypothetical protein